MFNASTFISDSNYYRREDQSNQTSSGYQERITHGLHKPHDSHVTTLTLESNNDELDIDDITSSHPPNLHTDTPPVSAVHSTPHSTSSLYVGSPDNEQLANSLLNDPMMVAGMLTPALAIVPELRSADCLYEKYKNLQGKERDLILAAAHIDDARTERGRYGRAKYYFKNKIAQMAFKVITNKWFQRLIYTTVLLHSFLAFFEPPSVKPQSIETYVALSLNLLCLSVYLMDIVLNVIFLSWRVFWAYEERSWIRVQFVFFCCFAIDWILLMAQVASGNRDIVQPFRCLRLAMIVCKAKNVGHITNVVKSITIKLAGVMFIVLIFIVLYSCIGVHLAMVPFAKIQTVNISAFRPPEFEVQTTRNETTVFIETCSSSTVNDTNIYEGAFNHIGTAIYQMFILLTTENYPIIMFPAFHYSQWYFIYFGSFLIFGVFFITSILLAIIADLYWQYNKKHLKKERAKQRAELVKAWKFLDVLSQERLPVDDERLLKLFRLLKPENTDSENRHLIAELDPEHTGWVDWIFWVTQLLSVLDLEKTALHSTSKHSSSSAGMVMLSRVARKITAWPAFDKIILFLIIFHTVLFAVKWEGMSPATELVIQGLRTSTVTVFLVRLKKKRLEMCVRLVGKGRNFFNNAINALDFTLVMVAFVTNALWYAILSPALVEIVESFLWRGSFVVISSLTVFTRLFFNSKQIRLVMNVFFRLLPVMLDLMILFGIVLYFYGVLGMESFHSFSITMDTPDANHLQYGCGLGFENFKCSLFMVFQILTTSNWHEIMNTVIVSLDSFAPVIYFIPCFIVINFIIMNLLVAIGIEAFNKFSQEQKDEEKEAVSSSTHSENNNRTVKEDISHYGQKLLIGLGYFAKFVFSSARMTEEEQNDSSVLHIDMQSKDHVTQSRHPSDHMTSESGSLSPSPSIHRSRLSSTDTHTEDSHSVIIVNQSHELQNIEDNVFVSPPLNEPELRINFAKRRQVKMQQILKERQDLLRMKSAARTVETAVALQSSGNVNGGSAEATATVGQKCEVTIEGCHHRRRQSTESIHDLIGNTSRRPSIKWGSAAQAISFIGHVAQIESANQFDGDIQRIGPDQLNNGNRPKFRRGYNNGNWRSEVQNLTIINKEEIHELRRQLAAKPSILHKRPSVDSTDSGDIGFSEHYRKLSLERQKRASITKDWSQDSTLTLNQLELQDTMQDQSKVPHSSSPIDNFITQSKPNSDPVPSYLTRRRSSSISNELKQAFERRYSSPRNSIEMEIATSQVVTDLSPQNKLISSNASTSVLNENDIKLDHLAQIRSSEKEHPGKHSRSTDEIESLDQISDDPSVSGSFHKDVELRNSRGFFKTPLISVKEVAEPTEFPVSNVILLESHEQKIPELGPGSRARRTSKEMPDWVKKLAEKYNMTVNSDRSSPPI